MRVGVHYKIFYLVWLCQRKAYSDAVGRAIERHLIGILTWKQKRGAESACKVASSP